MLFILMAISISCLMASLVFLTMILYNKKLMKRGGSKDSSPSSSSSDSSPNCSSSDSCRPNPSGSSGTLKRSDSSRFKSQQKSCNGREWKNTSCEPSKKSSSVLSKESAKESSAVFDASNEQLLQDLQAEGLLRSPTLLDYKHEDNGYGFLPNQLLPLEHITCPPGEDGKIQCEDSRIQFDDGKIQYQDGKIQYQNIISDPVSFVHSHSHHQLNYCNDLHSDANNYLNSSLTPSCNMNRSNMSHSNSVNLTNLVYPLTHLYPSSSSTPVSTCTASTSSSAASNSTHNQNSLQLDLIHCVVPPNSINSSMGTSSQQLASYGTTSLTPKGNDGRDSMCLGHLSGTMKRTSSRITSTIPIPQTSFSTNTSSFNSPSKETASKFGENNIYTSNVIQNNVLGMNNTSLPNSATLQRVVIGNENRERY